VISDQTKTYAKTTLTRSGKYSVINEYTESSVPCDVIRINEDVIQYIGSDYKSPCPKEEERPDEDVFENICDWRKRNWGNAKVMPRVVNTCKKLLRDNNLVACCDGSVNYGRAAHAWGLACKRKKGLFFSGSAPVDGHTDVLNSTRAEILGIIACVTFIQWISVREK